MLSEREFEVAATGVGKDLQLWLSFVELCRFMAMLFIKSLKVIGGGYNILW